MKYIVVLFMAFFPVIVFAQQDIPSIDGYVRAKVESVSAEQREENRGGISQSFQHTELRILDGEDQEMIIQLKNNITNDRDDMRLKKGETIILQRIIQPDDSVDYVINEKYRLPSLIGLTIFFFIIGVVLGGKIGFTSIIGLAASIAILILFVIPQIIAGRNPLIISLIGSIGIACTSLYLAHGFNRRTSIALLSTVITLSLSVLLAVIFVYISKLFGMGSEESVFLQSGLLEQVNLRGLLLGGIIIGALGVLDDITTAQTAAIDELSKANHRLGFKQLYRAGTSIGREHIASLINTLALAYVGASLPVLLLFYISEDTPWWVILNSEFVAEEVVRTLVGSSTLLLAVPISTYIAAKLFANGNHTNAKSHTHVH